LFSWLCLSCYSCAFISHFLFFLFLNLFSSFFLFFPCSLLTCAVSFFFYSQDKVVVEEAFVIRVRKNAVSVLVPRFGIEGPIHLDRAGDGPVPSLRYDPELSSLAVEVAGVAHSFKVFDLVMVQITVEESRMMQRIMKLRLVKPQLPGLSIAATAASAAAVTAGGAAGVVKADGHGDNGADGDDLSAAKRSKKAKKNKC